VLKWFWKQDSDTAVSLSESGSDCSMWQQQQKQTDILRRLSAKIKAHVAANNGLHHIQQADDSHDICTCICAVVSSLLASSFTGTINGHFIQRMKQLLSNLATEPSLWPAQLYGTREEMSSSSWSWQLKHKHKTRLFSLCFNDWLSVFRNFCNAFPIWCRVGMA